jgi:hypothetical protein
VVSKNVPAKRRPQVATRSAHDAQFPEQQFPRHILCVSVSNVQDNASALFPFTLIGGHCEDVTRQARQVVVAFRLQDATPTVV